MGRSAASALGGPIPTPVVHDVVSLDNSCLCLGKVQCSLLLTRGDHLIYR
jgi:hypothetical protein